MPFIRSTSLRLLLPIFLVAVNGTDLNRSDINSSCFDPITATWCAGAAGSALIGAVWSQLEGDGFRCCCDSDIQPEKNTLCRYITPKNNGKCPRADLGRGWTQTHSAQRNHGVLNPDKCILTGKEEIPRQPASNERMQCNAQEEMDAKVFPPEKAGNWAVRMAFAQVPAIGRLFVGVEDIQVTKVDMTIKLKRKSDDTFSFEVAGPDGKGNAVVNAWIQGIQFQLPESNADSVVKALSKMESIGGQIMSFGQAKNWGKIDVSPADAQFKMKGDFRINKNGEWEIVPESDSQSASVNLGNGGVLSGMLNLVIKHLGGMDKIFFDVVWPLVKELVPTNVGEAFQQVPFKQGIMEHNLEVSGKCKRTDASKTDTRQCPSHELVVDIRDTTTLGFRPRKIIQSLSELEFFQNGSFLDAFAKNTIKAYDQGEHALDGTMFKGHLGMTMNPDTGLTITGTPLIELPYDVLSRILGPSVQFGDFIGKAGALKAAGSGIMDKGVFRAKDLSLTGLALPVGDAGSIEVSAKLDDLNIEVEHDETPGSDLIFGKESPLHIKAPGLDLSLGAAEGMIVKPLSNLEGVGWKVALDPAYLDKVFKNITKQMLTPGSVRTEPEEKADGVVPKEFRRPHAFMKEPLDLASVLQDLDISTELVLEAKKDPNNLSEDMIDVNLDFTVTGELSLTADLWRGLTNNKDKDFGYLHFSLPGYYGEFGSRDKFDGAPAVAVLNCGSLWLYNAGDFDAKQKPFQKVIKALDIGDVENQKILAMKKVDQAFSCLQVEIDSAFIGLGTVRRFFCTNADNFKLLHEAMDLQLKRIRDANNRWRGACSPGPNGNPPACLGNPDGTWFTKSNPLDLTTWFPAMEPPNSPREVSSPQDQWKAALRSLLDR